MRLPRDLSGVDLARALAALGCAETRQTGGHMRLTTLEHGEHPITIPRHESLRIGAGRACYSTTKLYGEVYVPFHSR